MKNISYFLLAVMSLMATPCFATLGESWAGLNSTNSQLYSIQSYQTASAVNIREYVSKNGIVFAVSWNGPLKPNLQRLLGQHYRTLTAEITRKHHAGRSPVYIKRPDIVIESGGHPRYFFGRAYLPAAMPNGMKDSDIQ